MVFLFREFTKFSRAEYLKLKSEHRITPDGVNAKVATIRINLHELCVVNDN